MKLAKLIAEEHYRGSGKAYDMSRGMLENIVAAKLEPVKEVLQAGIKCALLVEHEAAEHSIRQAIALFEEE